MFSGPVPDCSANPDRLRAPAHTTRLGGARVQATYDVVSIAPTNFVAPVLCPRWRYRAKTARTPQVTDDPQQPSRLSHPMHAPSRCDISAIDSSYPCARSLRAAAIRYSQSQRLYDLYSPLQWHSEIVGLFHDSYQTICVVLRHCHRAGEAGPVRDPVESSDTATSRQNSAQTKRRALLLVTSGRAYRG